MPEQAGALVLCTMNLNTFFEHLDEVDDLTFVLPNGTHVPPHFHLTEVALVTKKYVDCGGTQREEQVISFQLWSADDYDHRLAPCRAYGIVERAQEALGFSNLEVEVEYQSDTLADTDWTFLRVASCSPPSRPIAWLKINAGYLVPNLHQSK